MLFPLHRKLCHIAILWDRVQRHLFYTCLGSESVFPNWFQWDWCPSVQDWIKIECISFLEVQKPLTNGAVVPFPSWAALTLAVLALPVLGTVGVAGPLLAGGSHPALLTLANPSGADSVAATVQGTQLCTEKQEHTTWNSTSILQTDFASTHFSMSITHQLDQTWDFITQYWPCTIWLPPLAVACQIIYLFGVGTASDGFAEGRVIVLKQTMNWKVCIFWLILLRLNSKISYKLKYCELN